MATFTMNAVVDLNYETAVERVTALLADAGFGVLTRIDLAATLKEKLDVDIPQQVILGACRPQLAHQALTVDPSVAALLPCNVVVAAEGPGSRVEVFDPAAMLSFSPEAESLVDTVDDARVRLQGVLDTLVRERKD